MRPLGEPITGQEILPPLQCVLFAEIIREHVHMLVRQWKLEGIDVRRICQLQRNVARACWMFKEWVSLSVLFLSFTLAESLFGICYNDRCGDVALGRWVCWKEP